MRVSLDHPSVRAAAAEFIRGTSLGWGRRDLARWLVCHYSPCLVSDATVHPDGHAAAVSASLSAASSGLDDERVEQLILDARSSVLRMLADLAWPSQAMAIAQSAIGSGSVIEMRDRLGNRSWAPVGRKRMRLADRVASLFIADALNTPQDYRNVSMCRDCGDLGFSAPIAHLSWCERARRVA
jgi:hypothetical protein